MKFFAQTQECKERIMSILSVFRRDNHAQKLDQRPACEESGFPICLSEGLTKMFGAEGKRFLDAVVMKGAFEQPHLDSREDICDLYARYMKRLAQIIGESPAQVIQFESFKQMESMPCAKCPLYEEERQRKKISSNA